MTRITEKGIKLLEKVKPEIDSLGSLISSALSNTEKKTLSDLLEKIYGAHI
jgi:DNA-binding MarR family transcriptional regulator